MAMWQCLSVNMDNNKQYIQKNKHELLQTDSLKWLSQSPKLNPTATAKA